MNLTHGDPGIVLGWDWSTGDHRLNSAAIVYLCLDPQVGDTLLLSADDPAVKVAPHRYAVPDNSNGVVPFRITATASGTAHLMLEVLDRHNQVRAGLPGPAIAAGGTNWHLFCPTASRSFCG